VSSPALEGTVQCVGKITDESWFNIDAKEECQAKMDISQVSMLKFLFFFQLFLKSPNRSKIK
jgi:hypothetical protein